MNKKKMVYTNKARLVEKIDYKIKTLQEFKEGKYNIDGPSREVSTMDAFYDSLKVIRREKEYFNLTEKENEKYDKMVSLLHEVSTWIRGNMIDWKRERGLL